MESCPDHQGDLRPIACIVLPTYDERENVEELLPRIFARAAQIPTHALHVLVVDDSSPDGTADAVRRLMTPYPNLHLSMGTKQGLGEAYKRGMAYALRQLRADLILEMDADLQHDPALLPSLVSLAHEGYGLVIGSRFASGGATPNFGWYRRLISLSGTWLVRLFGGLTSLTDCTSGYRCIRADVLARCSLQGLATRGYSFQAALLCELIRNGARVTELPIVFHERKRGESKLAFRDQAEFLLNLVKLRIKWPVARQRRADS